MRAIPNYTVVVERGETPNSLGAYVPDLPGCVAVGRTTAEVVAGIRGAIAMHVAGMIEDGVPVPEPTTRAFEIAESVR